MRRMREAGYTYKEIGKKLDTPWSTIRSRCQSLGIQIAPDVKIIHIRRRPPVYNFPPWLIRTLYWDCQLSTVAIAYELDVSTSTIQNNMKRYKIPRRSREEVARILHENGQMPWFTYQISSEQAKQMVVARERKATKRAARNQYRRDLRKRQQEAA